MERPPESIVPRPGLELRRHRVEDAPAVADGVAASLPELAAWLPWAAAEAADPARQRDRLDEGVRHWDRGTDFDYVLVADRRVAALGVRGVERVEIHCDEANERSAAVPRRLGYRLDRMEEAPVVGTGDSGRSLIWVYPPGDGGERGERGERAR